MVTEDSRPRRAPTAPTPIQLPFLSVLTPEQGAGIKAFGQTLFVDLKHHQDRVDGA